MGEAASRIIQLDDESKTEPVEEIQADVVAMPAVQAAVEEWSDETVYVTLARGTEIIHCFGDLIDPIFRCWWANLHIYKQ